MSVSSTDCLGRTAPARRPVPAAGGQEQGRHRRHRHHQPHPARHPGGEERAGGHRLPHAGDVPPPDGRRVPRPARHGPRPGRLRDLRQGRGQPARLQSPAPCPAWKAPPSSTTCSAPARTAAALVERTVSALVPAAGGRPFAPVTKLRSRRRAARRRRRRVEVVAEPGRQAGRGQPGRAAARVAPDPGLEAALSSRIDSLRDAIGAVAEHEVGVARWAETDTPAGGCAAVLPVDVGPILAAGLWQAAALTEHDDGDEGVQAVDGDARVPTTRRRGHRPPRTAAATATS